MSFNQIIIRGNVGRINDIKATTNSCVLNFTVAVNEKVKDAEDRVEWFTVESWGKQAQFLAEHMKKGQSVMVVGKIKSSEYENKDGATVKKTYVGANQVELL